MAYCTTAQVKTYLSISGSGDDSLLADLISRAESLINRYTHRTFEAAADSDRTFDALRDVEGQVLYLDEDLAAITTVTNGDSANTVITSGQYTTEPRNTTPYYALRILDSSGLAWEYDSDPEDAITITGRWAYSTTAPTDIEHACIALTAWLYRRRSSIGNDSDRALATGDGVVILPGRIPQDIKSVLDVYRVLT